MPVKKALVAAINAYPPPNQLPSCVADGQAFKSVLISKYGFAEDNIRTLFDQDVTTANFNEELASLFQGATTSDRLVVFYSGHGYQQLKDGVLQESLVLVDGFYDDDTLVSSSQDLPPGILTVVLDSCFSGGMEKQFFEAPHAGYERARVKVWFPDAEGMAQSLEAEAKATEVKGFGMPPSPVVGSIKTWNKSFVVEPGISKAPSEETGPQLNGLLVSACLEDETAAASTSRTGGLSAFTYCLSQAINTLGYNRSAKDLVAGSLTELRRLGFKQTPQLKDPGALSERTFVELSPATAAPGAAPAATDAQALLAALIALLGGGKGLPATAQPPISPTGFFEALQGVPSSKGATPSLTSADATAIPPWFRTIFETLFPESKSIADPSYYRWGWEFARRHPRFFSAIFEEALEDATRRT